VTAPLDGPQQIHDFEQPRTGRRYGLMAAGGADPIETEAAPESTQLKINMLLSCLPRLKNTRSTLRPRSPAPSINDCYAQLQQAHIDAAVGVVPELISCEICCYSRSDRSTTPGTPAPTTKHTPSSAKPSPAAETSTHATAC
jgi:hypothetical protein